MVTLDYDQHRHLHTNRYHARVLKDMLEACERALNNKYPENNKNINDLREIIENMDSEPASIKKVIKNVEDAIGNYLDIFKTDPVAKSKLTEEVTITLNAIKEALLDKSYMTKGIKEKLKGR